MLTAYIQMRGFLYSFVYGNWRFYNKTQLKIAMSLRDIPLADADCQGQLNWCSCAVIYVKEKPASLRQARFSNRRPKSQRCPGARLSVQQASNASFSHIIVKGFSSQALYLPSPPNQILEVYFKVGAVYQLGQKNKTGSKAQTLSPTCPAYALFLTLGVHEYPEDSKPKYFFATGSEARMTEDSFKLKHCSRFSYQKYLIYLQDLSPAQSLPPHVYLWLNLAKTIFA